MKSVPLIRSQSAREILSYSRSKGAFAGVALTGAVIQPGNDDMRDVYGAGVTAKEVDSALARRASGIALAVARACQKPDWG